MIGHGVLEPWEKELKAELIQQYENGEFLDMLDNYCHEGLRLESRNGKYHAYICSADGYGVRAKDAISDLAAFVYVKIVEKDMLGC